MIIDLILDRKEDDSIIAQGYTHRRMYNGDIVKIEYNAAAFYRAVLQYGPIGDYIAAAMDNGTECDVKKELCVYVLNNEYNPAICDYINSVNWL